MVAKEVDESGNLLSNFKLDVGSRVMLSRDMLFAGGIVNEEMEIVNEFN